MSSSNISVLIDKCLGSLRESPQHPGIRFKSTACGGKYWEHFNASDHDESVKSSLHSWKQKGPLIEICYHDILDMTVSLITSLIPYLDVDENRIAKDASPVIAVSIPEGPYLPLSVLAR